MNEYLAQITIPNFISANSFCGLLTTLAQQLGVLIAGIGTIMIIVAGIMFLLSAGSPERMGKAKAALTYAIIGLAIGIGATAIVEAIKTIISAQGGGCT